MFDRIKNDINGNSRFVCHFLDLETATPDRQSTLPERYDRVLKCARQLGGRRYHNNSYSGGVVFQAYEHQLEDIATRVRALGGAK